MLAVLTIIAIVSVLIIEKMFIKRMSFKLILIQYAGLITPLIVLNLLGIITGLAMSLFATAVLLGISLMFAILIAPFILLYEKLKEYGVGLQRVYIGYGSLILIMFITYIVIRIVLLSSLTELLDLLDDLDSIF